MWNEHLTDAVQSVSLCTEIPHLCSLSFLKVVNTGQGMEMLFYLYNGNFFH